MKGEDLRGRRIGAGQRGLSDLALSWRNAATCGVILSGMIVHPCVDFGTGLGPKCRGARQPPPGP
jgi:hypothetical protein